MQNQFFGEHIGALHSRNCDQASEDVAGAWNNSQTVFLALGAKYGYGIDFFISKEWNGCLLPTTVGEINGAISDSK